MNQSKNNIPELVSEIAEQVIKELPLEDRVKMANLDESQIAKTNQLLMFFIEGKLKMLASRQEKNGIYEIPLDEIDSSEATLIVNEIWKRLRKTHKLRVLK